MKKTLLALAAVIALLSCTSCAKSCHCSAYGGYEGNSGSTDYTMTLEDGQRCSDFNRNVSILGVSAGIKCTPQLF